MMMRPILCALALAGCTTDRRAEMLEADYSQAITTGDQCRIAGQITALYLEKSDTEKYGFWKSLRDAHCLAVSTLGNEIVR